MSEFGKTVNGASDLVMVQVTGGDVLLLRAKAVVIFEAVYDIEVWIRLIQVFEPGFRGIKPRVPVAKVVKAAGFVEDGGNVLSNDRVAGDCP